MDPKWPLIVEQYQATLVESKRLPPSRIATLPSDIYKRHRVLCIYGRASPESLRLHACWCASQTALLVDPPTPVPDSVTQALDRVERYARGQADQGELMAISLSMQDWYFSNHEPFRHIVSCVLMDNAPLAAMFAASHYVGASLDSDTWFPVLQDLLDRMATP